MTTLRIEKIGLVAEYSDKGDWAFRLAFGLARQRNLQLNIFHFLESPYAVPTGCVPAEIQVEALEGKDLIERDRKLREYYDDRLGDYVDVGFRVCEGARHNLELKRCLMQREYQLMVVPYLDYGVPFGNMTIEEFAYRFNAPLLLVGPTHEKEYHCNAAARFLVDNLEALAGRCELIQKPEAFQERAVI